MLTPDFLSSLEFNKVVRMYERLNIEITADIIERVMQMNEVTSTTKEQLRILKQINGTEIFNKTIEKTSSLTLETKEELKKMYEDVIKEDIQGYKELYKYRNKPFQISKAQYLILNKSLKQTNKTLKNLTNSIAFSSKQAYIETVDNAFNKVMSGDFSYDTAINSAVQDLAKKGITLKDKAGRNVQLEVAVRRNVMSGIREMSNQLNSDIDEYLGCDGYEVTAHMGARPGHAEAQGQQYAKTKKGANKYNLKPWSTVKDLWKEYNCRHTYFGIILGVSEQIYTKKELKGFKDKTVTLNGKEVPYYEATQKQRQLENEIRKYKKTVQTLKKSGQDTAVQRSKLRQLQKQETAFCNKTGLQKDYARTKVSIVNN